MHHPGLVLPSRPADVPAAIGAAMLALCLCFGIPAMPALAGEVTVSIDNFTFSPAEVTVAPGTTVTWVNNDDIPHTVVDKNLSFRSKALDTEDKFSFTFTNAGDYSYFCSLHPHMVGKVTVKSGG